MGKSDPYVFNLYSSVLSQGGIRQNSVAFLGFSGENSFTLGVKAINRDFYDLSLNNWEINSEWKLNRNYDLIVSTRCPYFSKDPKDFLKRCLDHLAPGGHALIDWGLGDHWRFSDYKVGWCRNGQREFAYTRENFLNSCYWNSSLESDEETNKFWEAVKKGNFGYENEVSLREIVEKEVPVLIDYKTKITKTLFMWPQSPQLYIATLVARDDYQ